MAYAERDAQEQINDTEMWNSGTISGELSTGILSSVSLVLPHAEI